MRKKERPEEEEGALGKGRPSKGKIGSGLDLQPMRWRNVPPASVPAEAGRPKVEGVEELRQGIEEMAVGDDEGEMVVWVHG